MTVHRRPKRIDEWLYVVIAGSLALYLVVGVVAWTWMIIDGIEVPAAFATVLASIAGGLIGALGPLRPPRAEGASSSEG